jgi:hypothetical protein
VVVVDEDNDPDFIELYPDADDDDDPAGNDMMATNRQDEPQDSGFIDGFDGIDGIDDDTTDVAQNTMVADDADPARRRAVALENWKRKKRQGNNPMLRRR